MDPGALRLQQIEENSFLAVIGTSRISGRRTDAAVFLGHQFFIRQLLVGRVPGQPRLAMQHLRQPLGQPVGQRFGHDRVVVVVVPFETPDQLFDADPRGHGEASHVVGDIGALWRHEVGQGEVHTGRSFLLLAQRMDGGDHPPARVVGVQLDVVANAVRRPEAVHRPRGQ